MKKYVILECSLDFIKQVVQVQEIYNQLKENLTMLAVFMRLLNCTLGQFNMLFLSENGLIFVMYLLIAVSILNYMLLT